MKRIRILLLCISLLGGISCHSNNQQTEINAAHFNEKGLIALGQLWGFLKYHHPAVAAGKYDWDIELIQGIPVVLQAKDEKEWKDLLNN